MTTPWLILVGGLLFCGATRCSAPTPPSSDGDGITYRVPALPTADSLLCNFPDSTTARWVTTEFDVQPAVLAVRRLGVLFCGRDSLHLLQAQYTSDAWSPRGSGWILLYDRHQRYRGRYDFEGSARLWNHQLLLKGEHCALTDTLAVCSQLYQNWFRTCSIGRAGRRWGDELRYEAPD